MTEKPEYAIWKGLIKDAIKEALAEDRRAAAEKKHTREMAMLELEDERKDDDGFSS